MSAPLHSAAARAGTGDAVRVMVVDDALVIRGMISRMLDQEDDLSVIATAGDGERALSALRRNPVDVVVLDIEMPNMDGLEALPKILEQAPGTQIVMASTLTLRNAEISLKAMQLGAADYVTKPGSSGELRSAEAFKHELVGKVRALGKVARRRMGVDRAPAAAPRKAFRADPAAKTAAPSSGGMIHGRSRDFTLRPLKPFRPDAIAIGSSTGGPQALFKVLKDLGEVQQPIFITQHMPPTFTTILAEHIGRTIGRPCIEASDGVPVEGGKVYLAAGDRHMIVKQAGVSRKLTLSDGPPENFCRPAVDPMLRALSDLYGSKLLVVILTGMGADGAAGAKICVEKGAQVLAQDEATSVVWGMPGAAAAAGVCGAVLPLEKIGAEIRRFAVNGGRP